MAEEEEYRNFTTRIKSSAHRRLRLLAASRDQTLSQVLTDLIEAASLETPDEVETFKSILYSAKAGAQDQFKKAESKRGPKDRKRKPEIIL